MVIFKGFGWAIIGVVFVSMLIVSLVGWGMTGDRDFYENHAWAPMLAMWLAAVGVAGWGLEMRRLPGRHLIDETSGKVTREKSRHTFFFIPVLWWAPLLVALGVLLYFNPKHPT